MKFCGGASVESFGIIFCSSKNIDKVGTTFSYGIKIMNLLDHWKDYCNDHAKTRSRVYFGKGFIYFSSWKMYGYYMWVSLVMIMPLMD